MRSAAAVVLASGGWLFFAYLPGRFELGTWYVILVICLMVIGPPTLAALVTLPNVRGQAMKVPAVAAAVIPPFVAWLVLIPNTSPDGTPTRLLSIPVFGVIALLGGTMAWCTAAVVEALQEPEG